MIRIPMCKTKQELLIGILWGWGRFEQDGARKTDYFFYYNFLLSISSFHNPVGLLPADRGGEAILENGTI